MGFSENLKMLRRDRNISQEQLAERINVSRQAVSKWEQGVGYPETEKLILISKEFNISLDYLLLDKMDTEDNEDMDNKNGTPNEKGMEGLKDTAVDRKYKDSSKDTVVVPTGKIAIMAHDGNTLVTCHKVSVSKILFSGKGEPQYILNGINKVTFWGEHTTILGWYATEAEIKREIEEISEAISQGVAMYHLRYAAKVKVGVIGVKLEK